MPTRSLRAIFALTCLLLGSLPYAPDSFTYTDPYGTAYKMAASGELKSITDTLELPAFAT